MKLAIAKNGYKKILIMQSYSAGTLCPNHLTDSILGGIRWQVKWRWNAVTPVKYSSKLQPSVLLQKGIGMYKDKDHSLTQKQDCKDSEKIQ